MNDLSNMPNFKSCSDEPILKERGQRGFLWPNWNYLASIERFKMRFFL